MTGSLYRKLRKESNKDDRRAATKEKADKTYSGFKADVVARFAQFNSSDDLFALIEVMRAGNRLMQKSGFPIDEFIKYEKN